MSIITTQYSEDTLSFYLDYSVSSDLYEPWKARLTKQFLENVEVKGFRTGKVPEKVALENIDPAKMQSTIFEETVMRFFEEARKEAEAMLKKDGRIPLDFSANFIPDMLPEIDEKGKTSFQFRANASLLPVIDLSKIKNKIEVTEIDEKDLPQRLTLQEFETREKDNLLANINAKREESKETLFKNWTEAFENLEDLRKQFKDEDGMHKFFETFYNQETDNLKASTKQNKIVEFVLQNTPPFALPQGRIDGEVARITQVLQEDTVTKKMSLVQVLAASGVPNPKKVEPKNILELSQIVYDYVQNEFKLTWILRYIYETELEQKPEIEIFEKATKQVQQKPEEFGLNKNATEAECQNFATDRIIRDNAGQILFSWVKEDVKKDSKKDKEIEKHDKHEKDELDKKDDKEEKHSKEEKDDKKSKK